MFERLFAESGLSLDRLRALVEVGAVGSIARAASGDAVRQSQYSRQIKELEDFFGARLLERTARGIQFTAAGKELARIARFSLLGLTNFQRGCLGEERTYRIGGSATFLPTFILPSLAQPRIIRSKIPYQLEALDDDSIERRLHDLTLDFGFVTRQELSRPLQSKRLLIAIVRLFAPKAAYASPQRARSAFLEMKL